jgi:hypothetical protein
LQKLNEHKNLITNLKFVDSDPRVVGDALEHWDKEHQAARPMDDEEHHADQVEDFHEYSNGLQELDRGSLVKSFRIQKVTIKKPSLHGIDLHYISTSGRKNFKRIKDCN